MIKWIFSISRLYLIASLINKDASRVEETCLTPSYQIRRPNANMTADGFIWTQGLLGLI